MTGVLALATALAFHPGGKLLVSGGYKEVLVWDLASGKLARRIGELTGQVRALAFGPDGRTLAVALGVPGRAGAVELVDFGTGAATTLADSKDEMLALAISPDGKFLAAGGTDAVVRVWSVADQQPAAVLRDHTDWISGVAFSPDSKLLATGSADKTVRLWDTATWKQTLQLPGPGGTPPTEAVTGVAFAPEGDMLAFTVNGPEERAIRLWRPGNANAPALTRAFDMGTCLPLAVTFELQPSHSRMVVGCTDKTVRVVGTGGNVISTLSGHTDWVYAVAASPDGQRFASGSGDGSVKVWAAAGKLLNTLTAEVQP